MPSSYPPGLPWWHPAVFARRRKRLEQRARLLGVVRRFFEERGFLEVETPALQISPGMEPHIRAFATEWCGPYAGQRGRLHLHTSPEFTMKKLLAAGVERPWQLCHAYRNGEATAVHHPEFTMIEWYRRGEGYLSLIEDCRGLVRAAAAAVGSEGGPTQFRFRGVTCDPFAEWTVLPVADAFRNFAGIDLLALTDSTADPDPSPLARAAAEIGLPAHDGDRWEDIFFRIMLDRIEPRLGHGAPTVLIDYPLALAALARPKPEAPALAERFELYACGLELANAFGELTDATAQRRRFEADQALKLQLYGEYVPIDEDFLAALAQGLPASAGIALGFDRLVMLCTGAEEITDILWAPVALDSVAPP